MAVEAIRWALRLFLMGTYVLAAISVTFQKAESKKLPIYHYGRKL